MPPTVSLSLLLFVNFKYVFGANILMAYDLPSPSHQLWDYAFAEGLMEKGHNVTMLGPFSDRDKSSDKYHPLVIEGILDVIEKSGEFNIEHGLWHTSPWTSIKLCMEYDVVVCNHSYHTQGFKALMDYPKKFKFDLIIIDMTLGPCFYPLIQRFNYPPTIGITAFLLPPFDSAIFGNDVHPSYLPLYHSCYTENMNFFQRVLNYAYTHLDTFIKTGYESRIIEDMARGVFGKNMDSMEMLQRHISLLLSNFNPVIHHPQPVTPNIIPVGGLHVKEVKELPADLKSIIDNAKNGVILFALGTNVQSAKLKSHVRQAFLDAFTVLNQTVIWKFEEELDKVPKNVVVRKWLPQNDILGHPNIRLFISHGGALSTYEAIYHGVPIIGMPFYIDQRPTVNTMAEKKLALKIELATLTSQEVLDNINEILNNPEYSKRMRELSERVKDQPETPLERAVFWTEFAMKHNGAHFLNPKSRDMSQFVSSSTDVILFLTFAAVSFVYLVLVAFKKVSVYLKARLKVKEKLS